MKGKRIFYLLLILNLAGCKGQEIKEVKLRIKNESSSKIDSVRLYFFNEKRTHHKINGNDSLKLEFKISDKLIPKGERSVFSLIVFKGAYYYTKSVGFIGFPTANLEEEYSFYIYDDYVTTNKNFVPYYKEKLKNISEFNE